MTFLRDIVVPILTAATTIACGVFTVKLMELGSIGGAFSVAMLTLAFGYFVYYDVRRLIAKIS